ncbi:MAG: threonine ammonia-lyase [Clostridiales bacterium]|jgi:threonine dehydratase|nr:threonine ammonia-lyase [Clostridiales bacterium]
MELKDVYAARQRLANAVHHTQMPHSKTFSALCGNDIYLKSEHQQRTGSFKVRGAYNKIAKLAADKKPDAVVASSAGNHAQGVAFAAAERGIESFIVMPTGTPIAKITATRDYGANVVLSGDCYDDAYNKAREIEKEKNAAFIHPFDDEDVIAGQGTVALEMLEDCPDLDVVIVPAGGGGLLAGAAFAIKNINPKIKVIGVQAARANAIVRSFEAKKLIRTDNIFTIADGIAVKNPGEITMKYISRYVDAMMTVTDEEIASCIIHLIERTKQIVEPAGAASLALALSGSLVEKNKKIGCLLSGGNIDVGFIHKIIEKGLVSRGRQLKFSVVLSDKPGSLSSFAGVMSDNNANIISVQYDRMSTEIHLNETILHITCEVGGFEHGKRVITNLEKSGYKVIFNEKIF